MLGTEAAFAAAGAGQESVFNRTRIRINTSSPGDFTVTWPYGQKTYHVDAVDPFKFEINESGVSNEATATPVAPATAVTAAPAVSLSPTTLDFGSVPRRTTLTNTDGDQHGHGGVDDPEHRHQRS